MPERGERIGMLLERFGLWDVRARARLDVLARDAAAARALPRPAARAAAAVLDEPYNALDAEGAALLDAMLDEPRTLGRRDARAAARRAARDRSGWRSHDATSPTSRALARKDLLLELRAKETLPSMLLFVSRR